MCFATIPACMVRDAKAAMRTVDHTTAGETARGTTTMTAAQTRAAETATTIGIVVIATTMTALVVSATNASGMRVTATIGTRTACATTIGREAVTTRQGGKIVQGHARRERGKLTTIGTA